MRLLNLFLWVLFKRRAFLIATPNRQKVRLLGQ
jgi:hypothetical protein